VCDEILCLNCANSKLNLTMGNTTIMAPVAQEVDKHIDLMILKRDIVGSTFVRNYHPISSALVRAGCDSPMFDGYKVVFKHTVSGKWLCARGLFWLGCKTECLKLVSRFLSDDFVLRARITAESAPCHIVRDFV